MKTTAAMTDPSRTRRRPGFVTLPLTVALALTATLALGLLPALAPPARAHLSIIRQGSESRGAIEPGDRHGSAVAAGDFNGDGFDDLATGAPFEDISSALDAGAVVVNFGNHFGLTHVGAVLLQQSDFGLNSPNDEFGAALTAGDFNHDGYDDLAVGAPGADLGLGGEDIGGVFVYLGGASGLSPVHDLTQGDGGGSHEAGDRFGAALCTGDFNGDGTADIGVGSPGEDASAGAAFWFCGGTFGLVTGPNGWFKQSSLGGVNTGSDNFGLSVAAGNVAGSAHDDLIIGTPYKDFPGVTNAGAVFVVLGSAGGPNAATRRTYDAATGDLGGRQASGRFGFSVAAGHFYGGSWDGLAIGEPGRNASGSVTLSGRIVTGKGGSADVDWTGAERIILTNATAGGQVLTGELFGSVLAAGFYDAHDGYEDLLVGSPHDKASSVFNDTGWAGLFYGGSAGPTGSAWGSFFQSTCNDPIESGDLFGASICAGDFDGTGRGNLAVGAPGEDGAAGMVHVIAPWRQNLASQYRTQLAVDCEGNPVFSVKPFDEVCIASTTKAMTALIACERTQLPTSDPKYVSLDAYYTVPDWIRNNVGGSLYMFKKSERLQLRDLLYACIFPSGNDAAYAIADMLTGGNNPWLGYDSTCPVFVAEMNQRAQQLGMTQTVFTNPPGLDVGDHHSTAYDMALLGRAAMANSRLATVVGSTNYSFTRTWKDSNNNTISGSNQLSYGFLQMLQSRNSAFGGVKPGKTPCAQRTGVMAATSDNGGKAIATAFGHDSDLPRAGFYDEAAALMKLGLGECGSNLVIQTPSSDWNWALGNLSTAVGAHSGGGSAFEEWDGRAPFATVDLYRPTGGGTTLADFEIQRSSDVYFDPGETITFGIAPFQGRDPILIDNLQAATAHFRVTSSRGESYEFSLAQGERAIVPCVRDPDAGYTFDVINLSGAAAAIPMNLGITESYDFEFTGIASGANPFFTAQLRRPAGALSDGFQINVTGRDPNPGQTLYAALHDPGAVSQVGPGAPPADPVRPIASLLSADPNPFSDRIALRFNLREAGPVTLTLVDVQGRKVRTHEATPAMAGPWSWAWNGQDDNGRPMPPGVYFYRLDWNGRAQLTGRVNLAR